LKIFFAVVFDIFVGENSKIIAVEKGASGGKGGRGFDIRWVR
jgi:hypothetical protein